MVRTTVVALLMFVTATAAAAEPDQGISLFNGKDLTGWEGDVKKTWRVEDGAIVGGSLEAEVPHNEFLCTRRRFGDFELRVAFKLLGDRKTANAGIQFRSSRIPKHFEVRGYQADVGQHYWGALYDEARRNKVLKQPPQATLDKIVKHEDWNEYLIRCQGPRIQLWLNGTLTVDYTEPDAAIEQTGIIGLQVHGGGKTKVLYKDIYIKELPPSSPLQRFADPLPAPAHEAFEAGKFVVRPGEVIVFTGSANAVFEQQRGELEALLATAAKDARPVCRHMGWEGDTVYEQWRAMNFGGWNEQFKAINASCIVTWFGQIEALDDNKSADDFRSAYGKLLDQFRGWTPRIVVLSPLPFEKPRGPWVPDNTKRNARVQQHAETAAKLASERHFIYVDLLTPLAARTKSDPPLTENGMHLTPEGQRVVAALIAEKLGISAKPTEQFRREITRKNKLWFDCWRTMNWYFAYGDRTTQPFPKAGGTHPPLAEELEKYKPLLRNADARIHALALGQEAPVVPAITPEAKQDRHDPAEEQKSFTLRPGIDINLFASEADGLVKPIQMCWDERGRLWALCCPSYPQLVPGINANDYILVCEDTDGDGRADKFTRFAEGLNMPTGMVLGDGGVYVCEATQLIHIRKDKDGKAGKRRVLFSGFGTGDSHQMINSLCWGPDGCLWFTQGLHIFSIVETPWGLSRCGMTGIWRLNPRTLRLNNFLGNAAASENAWGVGFDLWGQTFYGAGNDPFCYYIDPALVPVPVEQLAKGQYHEIGRLAQSNTKGMRIEFIHSRHLPDDLQGALIKPLYLGSRVELHRLKEQGAGFASELVGPLMSSKSDVFRPVEGRIGPDGAIYICDWYNPIIGHYQASYRDPRRDHAHGRVWRLTAHGRPLVKAPQMGTMTVPQLFEQLASPDRWVRDRAKFALYDRPAKEVIAAADAGLEKVAPGAVLTADAAPLLYEAIGIYAAHEEVRPKLLQRLLDSPKPELRAFGARMLALWAPRLPDPLAMLRPLVGDENPRVRMEAAVAASYIRSPAAVEVATAVLDRPRDKYIDYALTQTVRALKPQWNPALARGELHFDNQPEHLRFVLTADGSKDVAGHVRKLATAKELTAPAREALLSLLVDVGDPNDLRYALEQGNQSVRVLNALAAAAQFRNQRPPGDLVAPVQKMLAEKQPELRAAALRLAGWWRLQPLTKTVRAQLDPPNTPEAVVRAALRALGQLEGKEALPVLTSFATTERAPAVRATAIAAIVPIDLDQGAGLAAKLMAHAKNEDEMTDLLTPLLGRKSGTDALAKSLGKEKLPIDAAKLAHRALSAIGRGDVALLETLNKTIGLSSPKVDYSAELVRALAGDAKDKGNAGRGKTVFLSKLANCTACHRLDGKGGEVGPDLSSVGTGLTTELIVESILWPNRQIKEGYMATKVTTTDGRSLVGYKVKDTADEVQLRDPTTRKITRIAKKDVDEMAEAGSVMPEGLTASMTRAELLDLIRFLSETGRGK
jgi:putative heme-binding domain-containing protein